MQQASKDILIRELRESELSEAGEILRLAFATRVGARPNSFWTDRDYVRGRWLAHRSLAFGAWIEGRLVGSNFGVNWGSLGFFGPLSTHPDLWNRGIARHLVGPVVERLDNLGVRHIGLFTFAESAKHVALYQKFGFWPRFLTAVMSLPVVDGETVPQSTRYSAIADSERAQCIDACRALTNELHDGLDLTAEIRSVQDQGRGDTLFLWQGSLLEGVALCDFGPRSPAGAGSCLIRFGAVRTTANAERHFDQLLAACRTLAMDEGLTRLLASVNTSRHKPYRQLLARGFRAEMQGVTMHRPNEDGYNKPNAYILDDWR